MKTSTKKLLICFLLLIFTFYMSCLPAYAIQGQVESLITRISSTLQSSAITARMLTMGKSVFAFLAFLQFVWAIYQLALDNRLEIQAMVMAVIRQIIYLGMFFLIVSEGPTFLREIGLWLADAGQSIGGVSSIDQMFSIGLNLGGKLISAATNAFSFSLGDIGPSIVGVLVSLFSALIIIISFTFAGITALVASCKIYLVASVGALCLGFSGNSYTKDIAINAIRAALACGAELMTIYIIIGLANAVFISFNAEAASLQAQQIVRFCLQTLACALIFTGILMTFPGYISGLFFGSGSGGSSAASSGLNMANTTARTAMRASGMAAGATMGYVGLHNKAQKIAETSGRLPSNWNSYREPNQSSNYVDP